MSYIRKKIKIDLKGYLLIYYMGRTEIEGQKPQQTPKIKIKKIFSTVLYLPGSTIGSQVFKRIDSHIHMEIVK